MAQSLRHNAEKIDLSKPMLFRRGLEMLTKVMDQGEIKYPDVAETGLPNWMQGGKPDTEYLGAIARHLAAFRGGEEWDEELGVHHVAQIVWNALALLTLNTEGPVLNPDHDQEAFVEKWRRFYEGNPAAIMIELSDSSDG